MQHWEDCPKCENGVEISDETRLGADYVLCPECGAVLYVDCDVDGYSLLETTHRQTVEALDRKLKRCSRGAREFRSQVYAAAKAGGWGAGPLFLWLRGKGGAS